MSREAEEAWRSARGDTSAISHAWEKHGNKLLKAASRVAEPDAMARLLDLAQETDTRAEMTVLEQTAISGNVGLFTWMLNERMKPTPEQLHNYWVRLYAVTGGVDIWKALLAYYHECISWPIGEHGDALGQAVLNRDAALVRFLLEEGIDVKASNFVGMPVLQAAKSTGADAELVELLRAYGAPE